MEVQIGAAGDTQVEDMDNMISSTAQAIPHERSGMNGEANGVNL